MSRLGGAVRTATVGASLNELKSPSARSLLVMGFIVGRGTAFWFENSLPVKIWIDFRCREHLLSIGLNRVHLFDYRYSSLERIGVLRE